MKLYKIRYSVLLASAATFTGTNLLHASAQVMTEETSTSDTPSPYFSNLNQEIPSVLLPYAPQLLEGIEDQGTAKNIIKVAISLSPEKLDAAAKAYFDPAYRHEILQSVGRVCMLKADKIPFLKTLLTGVTQTREALDIFDYFYDAPLEILRAVADADFAPKNRAPILKIARRHENLAPEKIAPLALLIKDIQCNAFDAIFYAASHLSMDMLYAIVEANISPQNRADIMHKTRQIPAPGLTPDTFSLTMKLITDIADPNIQFQTMSSAAGCSTDILGAVLEENFPHDMRWYILACTKSTPGVKVEKLPLLKALTAGATSAERISIVSESAPLSLGMLAAFVQADFSPSQRASVMRSVTQLQEMTPEKILFLKELLADISPEQALHFWTLTRATHLAPDMLRAVSQANFAPELRHVIMSAINHHPNFPSENMPFLRAFITSIPGQPLNDLIGAIAPLSLNDLQFVQFCDFEPEQLIGALREATLLRSLDGEKITLLKTLMTGVTDYESCQLIISSGAPMSAEQLRRIIDANFAPEHRYMALDNFDALTPENIPLMKLLLAGTTQVWQQRNILYEGKSLSVEQLQWVIDADFHPDHRSGALKVVNHLTPEKIALIKTLVSDLNDAMMADQVIQVAAPLSLEQLRLIIDARFTPDVRFSVLKVADHLTQDTIPSLKAFLESDGIELGTKNRVVSYASALEPQVFPLFLPLFDGVLDNDRNALVDACLGKSEDLLRAAMALEPGHRLAHLNTESRAQQWLFAHMGRGHTVDSNIIVPEIIARLFVDEQDVLASIEAQLESADRDTIARTCTFILSANSGFGDFNFERFGWNEDHDIVQNAIRKKIVLSQPLTDPKNPWRIWGEMLNRRAIPADFDAVTPPHKVVAGKNVTLNPAHIARFSQGFSIDEKSVPSIAPTHVHDLLEDLEARLTPGLRAEIEGMQDPPVSFAGLKLRALGASGRSFLTTTLNGKKNSLSTARLMCVLNHLHTFDAHNGTPEKLSSRDARLVQILLNLRNCNTGQNTDLEELYNNLPVDFKYTVTSNLFDWDYISADERRGYSFLMQTVGEGAFQAFGENNALMRRICGLPESGLNEEGKPINIAELTHQTKYVLNFIGRDVGANHPDSFPHNAELFYEHMLSFEKTPLIKMYYDYIWESGSMIDFFRRKINEAVKPLDTNTSSNSSSSPATGGLFTAIDSLRPGHMSVSDMWDVDDETYVTTLTDEGLVALLLKAGILQENESALPWGSITSKSSSY